MMFIIDGTGDGDDKLNNNNDIISKLTLLMFWESYCENIETDKLLSDKELIKFISPHNENVVFKIV